MVYSAYRARPRNRVTYDSNYDQSEMDLARTDLDLGEVGGVKVAGSGCGG